MITISRRFSGNQNEKSVEKGKNIIIGLKKEEYNCGVKKEEYNNGVKKEECNDGEESSKWKGTIFKKNNFNK